MCLTSSGNRDRAKLFYSTCSEKKLNQLFVFKRLEGDIFSSFSSFGRFYSAMASDDFCVETHSVFDDQVFMHRLCMKTFEITRNGALRSIEEGKCLGFDGSDETKVNVVDCGSEYADIWNSEASFINEKPYWTSLKTLGSCADFENKENSFDGMKVELSPCNSSSLSQQWYYDDLGRLINRNTIQCLEGNLHDNVSIWDCNDEMSQRWSKNGNKFLNEAYQKYLGVASCGNITNSSSKFLELQDLNNTGGTCSDAQTWDVTTNWTCENNEAECNYWAEIGLCDKNPSKMRSECKRACGLCHQVCLSLFINVVVN